MDSNAIFKQVFSLFIPIILLISGTGPSWAGIRLNKAGSAGRSANPLRTCPADALRTRPADAGRIQAPDTPSVLVAKIPFDFSTGRIVVAVRINGKGRVLHLLFDTGADGMALNGPLADSLGLEVSRSQDASVVGGTVHIDVSTGNTVSLGDLQVTGQSIGIFRSAAMPYDGIIGIGLAMKYIVHVDFDRDSLELYSFGKYAYGSKETVVSMVMNGHTPTLPIHLEVGNKKADGDFVFDTGAGYDIIGFGPFVHQNLLLVGGFKPYYVGSTVSAGQQTTTYTGDFSLVQVDSICFHHIPGSLQAYRADAEKWARGGVGSLGIQLISRFNFTLDLKEGKIGFTPNQSFARPFDIHAPSVTPVEAGSREVKAGSNL